MLNGGLIGSLLTLCIKIYVDNRRAEKIRLEDINRNRLHKAYSPLYLYSSLNIDLAENMLGIMKDIKYNLENTEIDKKTSSTNKVHLLNQNQERLLFFNDKIIALLNETFGYFHAEDEGSIIQYLTLSEKILRRAWHNNLTLIKVDAAITCFNALCFILNIIKSRTHVSTCETKTNLDLISLNSALEILAPTIIAYENKKNKYDLS